MLTLAFSQMFYAYTFQVAWLGAEDGLVGVPRPRVLGLGPRRACGGFHGYLLVLVAARRSCSGASSARPFGHVLRGIHENEARMEAVGYPVRPLQAPRLRHRGHDRGRRRLALHAVQRLDHAGRVLLDDVGRGAADGHHRRHRHPRRRRSWARPPSSCCRACVSSYTERWMLILGLDVHPLRALRPRRHRGRAARAGGTARVTGRRCSPSRASRAPSARSWRAQRRVARGRPARAPRHHRPQRGGQDHALQRDHRPARADARAHPVRRRARSTGWRPTRWPAAASRARSSATTSSRSSRCWRTCGSPPRSRPGS